MPRKRLSRPACPLRDRGSAPPTARPLGRRIAARALSVASFLALAAAPPAGASATGTLASVQSDLAQQLRIAGPGSSAYVYDMSAKAPLFSVRATAMRPPASVEKLYTATTALERLGPSAQLTTTVLGTGKLEPGGVWQGNLYLRGGGDPTFGSSEFIDHHYGGIGASVSVLVGELLHTDKIRSISGSIYGDESYLDSLRGEPSSGYAPDYFLEGALSGLAFNRGASGRETGSHAPAAYAARELRVGLQAAGVSVHGSSGAARTPSGATQLAQVRSPTLAQLVGLMLPPSDNFFAETLVKDLGALVAGHGTTAAGASVVSQTVAALLGIHPQVVDGSGLSEADRTSTYEVADLLVELGPTPIGGLLRSSLAVAGRTGTLSKRMRGTGAAGRCAGKTGTLTGFSNLVGYCQAGNGHLLAFAFFDDGISTTLAHVIQDHMTITLADSSLHSSEETAAAASRSFARGG